MSKFNEKLFVKLSGEGVSLDNLNASELAEFITAHEKALLAEMRKDLENQISDEDATLSLVAIREGSIQLVFNSHHANLHAAFKDICHSIINQTIDKLSNKTQEYLKTIKKIVKKHGMTAEFYDTQGVTAFLTSETPMPVDDIIYIMGETTLYGRVERVGGKTPKVCLMLGNNETIICEIKESLAIELANYLYQWVSVFGQAKWNSSNYSIESFKILGINKEFQAMPLSEAFQHLSQEIGHYYDEIDPIEYVQAMRDDD